MRVSFRLKGIIIAALLGAVLVFSCAAGAGSGAGVGNGTDGGQGKAMAEKQYKDRKFNNTHPVADFSFGDYMKMSWEFFTGGSDSREPVDEIPIVRPQGFSNTPDAALSYIWLGHSTVMLEIEGRRLLLDPMFSRRASFYQWVGPKAFHPNPIEPADLPAIDAVLISHNHYDHLDRGSVESLKDRGMPFVVPMGVGAKLIEWGVKKENITELGWWDEVEVGGLKIASTPARHFSGRGMSDRYDTLWTSWAIAGQGHRVFFSGDTGMTPEFADIGEKHGPFDLTFIEIAAYNEMWSELHMFPEQAVEAGRMLKGRRLVPIHWGKFDLALHGWKEPIERMVKAADGAGVRYLTSKPGQRVEPESHENSLWWEGLK